MRGFRSWAWVLLLVLPCVELVAHARIVAGVAPDSDWRAAATFVRSQLQAGDLITSAPSWTDPVLRLHLGDVIPLSMAGRSDTSAYTRAWVLSVRDGQAADVPADAKPEVDQRFGALRVARYALGKSPVLFDFVEAWRNAKATITRRGREEPCEQRDGGVPRGGGLGKGVLYPVAQRFECDARRPWLFVAPVVLEDLDLAPRYCLWQHAQGDDPVSMTFDDVPLGDELVFYGGIYYEHERMREHHAVRADIFIDGKQSGTLSHSDGDGWKRLRIATPGGARKGSVRVEVRAHEPDKRSFCWAATTRSAAQEPRP